MLNEDRIKIMTDLAFFNQGNGSSKLKISGYYRKDYVGLKMITTALWVVVGYVLLLVIIGTMFITQILGALTTDNIVRFVAVITGAFVVLLIVYLCMAYTHFSRKHRIARRDVKKYYAELRVLERMYENEEREELLKTEGGSLGGNQ